MPSRSPAPIKNWLRGDTSLTLARAGDIARTYIRKEQP